MQRRRVGAFVFICLLVAWGAIVAVPALAGSEPTVDPRFDVDRSDPPPLTVLHDEGTDSYWAHITPSQPWDGGPPSDLSSSYFTLELTAGDTITIHWERDNGTTSVDTKGGNGIYAWSGYVLTDGTLAVWLPLPLPPPDSIVLDLEMGAAATPADPGGATTYGATISTGDAEDLSSLFGENPPVWDLGKDVPMAPRVTSSSEATVASTPSDDTISGPSPSATVTSVTVTSVTVPPTAPTGGSGTIAGPPPTTFTNGSSWSKSQIVIVAGGLTLLGAIVVAWILIGGRSSDLVEEGESVDRYPFVDEPEITDEEVADAVARTSDQPTGDPDVGEDLDELEVLDAFEGEEVTDPGPEVDYPDDPDPTSPRSGG